MQFLGVPALSAAGATHAGVTGLAFAAFVSRGGDERGSQHSEEAFDVDRADIRGSIEGDGESYRRLVARYQDHVSAIMWRFSRDKQVHIELVQDVFVESYLSLRTYRGDAPFSHWLTRVATRRGFHYWKLRARQRTRQETPLTEGAAVSLEEMSPELAAVEVSRLLARLPPRDRLVLTLRYLEDCTTEETARRTGWSRTMVKVQCWRALRKLRRITGEDK
ncbi:MAG: RNA polymerase sigma factor [Acidobacteriota bacterium]